MQLLRKWAIFSLAFAFVLILAPTAHGEQTPEEPIRVFFNDDPLVFEVDPVIENGVTLVEFRTLFERIGLEIGWDAETQTVTGSRDGLKLSLTIGSKTARINGKPVELDAAPKIMRDKTVVPLRFAAEAAGSDVRWDGAARTIRMYHIGAENLATDTNVLRLSGRVSPDVRWIRFEVTKESGNDTRTDYAEAKNGYVEHDLFLHDGPGIYTVAVYQTIAVNRNSSLYRDFGVIRVENRGYSGLHVLERSTGDSRVTAIGNPPEGIRSVLLEVIHNISGDKKQVTAEAVNGRIEKTVYLNFGKGLYRINAYTSEESLATAREFLFYKTFQVLNLDARNRYLVPSEKVESDHPDIVKLAEELTRDKKSDAEKSRAIHDWVIANVSYDPAVYFDGIDRSDTALETLNSRLADCDGYARLNAALHRAAGIPARIVLGTLIDRASGETWDGIGPAEVNHAWNEVFIDGRWMIQDPTLNSGYIDLNAKSFVRRNSHFYYDPDREVFALDHREARGLNYVFD